MSSTHLLGRTLLLYQGVNFLREKDVEDEAGDGGDDQGSQGSTGEGED
jgi:hypothetical protein